MIRRPRSLTLALAVAVPALMTLTACAAGSGTPQSSTVAPGPSNASSSTTSTSGTSSSAAPASTEVAEGTLDQNLLAKAITTNLTNSLGAGVTVSVICAPGVVIAKDAVSGCDASVDGQPLPFTVTQTDDEGNVDFAAAAALLDLAALTTQTAQQYGEQKGGTWTTTCSSVGTGGTYRVEKVGATFDCTFSGTPNPGAAEESHDFTVTVTDLDGNISWAEK